LTKSQPEGLGGWKAVKATGQAGYAEDEYPFCSLHLHRHRCFDAFGPERMFWSTDIGCLVKAERRQSTVMFCDLVSSTALSTHLDPEDFWPRPCHITEKRAFMEGY